MWHIFSTHMYNWENIVRNLSPFIKQYYLGCLCATCHGGMDAAEKHVFGRHECPYTQYSFPATESTSWMIHSYHCSFVRCQMIGASLRPLFATIYERKCIRHRRFLQSQPLCCSWESSHILHGRAMGPFYAIHAWVFLRVLLPIGVYLYPEMVAVKLHKV